MNILILGNPDNTIIHAIKTSSYLEKLYTVSPLIIEGISNIEITSLDDLVYKTKLLKIDITLVFDNETVKSGISEYYKEHRLNIISVNKKWLNLETSQIAAKKLLNYYKINTPSIIKAPLNFPVNIKTNFPDYSKTVYSMTDLIACMESLDGKDFFIEEYLNGQVFEVLHLWDGENLLIIPTENMLSEVQTEKIKLYNTKMNFLLSDEKADFIGFFTSKLIWVNNEWYVLSYKMCADKYCPSKDFRYDFLFLLNSAIYRKLNELI